MYFFVKDSRRKSLVEKSSMVLEGIGLAEEKKHSSEKSIIKIDVCLSEDSQASEMVSFIIFLVFAKN